MHKQTFSCPTCEKVFETQVKGFSDSAVACIRYCSVACNPGMDLTSVEKTCECGTTFDSYRDEAKCQQCRLPTGLRNALARIEAEYGVTE